MPSRARGVSRGVHYIALWAQSRLWVDAKFPDLSPAQNTVETKQKRYVTIVILYLGILYDDKYTSKMVISQHTATVNQVLIQ